MYEILLTRIFSVTMWYHFAFMAISVAMFGMTVGALMVYLFPRFFSTQRVYYHLALSAFLLSLTIVLSFLTHLSIPILTNEDLFSFVTLYALILTYVVISIPFVFSGICVCLALTRFPSKVSKLYAADLAGAALGCILLIYLLDFTSGPTAVFGVAALAGAGAVLFTLSQGFLRLRRLALVFTVAFGVFTIAHTVLVAQQRPWIRLLWTKAGYDPKPLFEKWNSFSRIRIIGDTAQPCVPHSWGLSKTCQPDSIHQLDLNIDATAATMLSGYNGNVNEHDYLKYDITNLAHHLRHDADVLVVGAGGGRDIISALVFNQKSVLGVEINQDIISTVNGDFGDFTGHLDRDPRIGFVADEARSYISRSRKHYDIIVVSLIDTWAATAAGAFVLTENALYTVEAWTTFLDHLTPNGVLSFSRWYFRGMPGEMYRVTSLAAASLQKVGVQNPRDHIYVARNMTGDNDANGIGTILVSRRAFRADEIDSLDALCAQMQFDVDLSPRSSYDYNFATIASGGDLKHFYANLPLDVTPPTDDNPFFFQMLRLKDFHHFNFFDQGIMNNNVKAIAILAVLMMTVLFLTLLCIIVPLLLTRRRVNLRDSLPLFFYFGAIGFGFMLVEISQMQRLVIFLGHPIYSLSVVLFALLLSSGLGSFATERITFINTPRQAMIRLVLLAALLVIFGVLTPYAITHLRGAETPLRILTAVAILFPLGFLMGMAFPLGMKVASQRSEDLGPWLWGINGATSVCASVFAIAIALAFSISTAYWMGFIFYSIAILACLKASHGTRFRA
jgi:hypothetical protein